MAVPLIRMMRKRTEGTESSVQYSEKSEMPVPPFLELAVTVLALVFFIIALAMSGEFSENGRLFPLAVGGVGILLSLISLGRDMVRVKNQGLGRFDEVWMNRLKFVGLSIAWILAYIWLVFLFGMLVESGVFALVFLLVVARMKASDFPPQQGDMSTR